MLLVVPESVGSDQGQIFAFSRNGRSDPPREIHRDLKPENVFLTQDGTEKVLDFGLAQGTIMDAAFVTLFPDLLAVARVRQLDSHDQQIAPLGHAPGHDRVDIEIGAGWEDWPRSR